MQRCRGEVGAEARLLDERGEVRADALDLEAAVEEARNDQRERLAALVEQGEFRADLYFRLHVLPISVPSLRERLEDVEPLCEVLLEQIAVRAGVPSRQLDDAAVDLLRAHRWPGNVRELRNTLEQACMLSDGPALGREDFLPLLPAEAQTARPAAAGRSGIRPLAEAIAELERASIRAALEATGGKKAPAAKLLGISRSSFYEKMVLYGISSESRT